MTQYQRRPVVADAARYDGSPESLDASGRQVQIRLSPTGRKAKVYVDGTEIQSA